MSEPSSEEPSPKRNSLKTTLDVSITMALITTSKSIKVKPENEIYLTLLGIFAPLVGLILSSLINYGVQTFEYNQDEKRIKKYIDDLEFEIRNPKLSRERKKALIQEQILHQEDLVSLRRRRSKRKMF